jgi:Fic family protein
MNHLIYNFSLELTMALLNDISKIDRFDATWHAIEKREGISLKQLKKMATVRSVASSTRIEGSKLTDKEVEILIENINFKNLTERDEQEVAGYFEAVNIISDENWNIDITEGNIRNLHNILMQYCEKDKWHRGKYKQVSNAVEATYPDGSKQIVFKTAEPGYETQLAMKNLLDWYHNDKETLPIIKTAFFIYDFLSIHPFQDGNGRLSRLLTTLLLLRQGYSWIEYVSFEHEIENRKKEYYSVLMQTQRQRPNEKLDKWLHFFLNSLNVIQTQLMQKLKKQNKATIKNPREKEIIALVGSYPGIRSGEIAKRLNLNLSTTKKILSSMAERNLILKSGIGKGTNYSV